MERPECLPRATWELIVPEAQVVVAAVIVALEARIAALEARLGQNSSNSSRPPSSDGPRVKRGVPRLIRRHRDRAAFDDLVGPGHGVLTTDRFTVYKHLDPNRRQVCWAHSRRDFQAMIDRRDRGSPIGEELLFHADMLAREWAKVRAETRTRAWFSRMILPWLREEVRLLLEAGSRCDAAKTAAVRRELLNLEASLWTFARVPGVEPTNNAAERAVRHGVCWRKTSHGADGERGGRFVERILTVAASCRAQGRDVMDFLTQAITAHRGQSETPSLLPQGA